MKWPHDSGAGISAMSHVAMSASFLANIMRGRGSFLDIRLTYGSSSGGSGAVTTTTRAYLYSGLKCSSASMCMALRLRRKRTP